MKDRCVLRYSISILLGPSGRILELPGGTWGGGGVIRRRGRAGSGRAIVGVKKLSEGAKASERGKWQAFGQTGSQRRGSAGSSRKIVEGDTGE